MHPLRCRVLLGKMLRTPLPETCMLSLAFSLRTIVSKYSCASAIFHHDLNFYNIDGRPVHLSQTATCSSLQAWLESTLLNAAAPVHFATHLSGRWRNVDMVQIVPLESFCALNPTVPACSYALGYAELSWPGRGMVQPYRSWLRPQLGLCNEGTGE